MIRIAVVEDEIVYARQLEQYLRQYAGDKGLTFGITNFEDGLSITADTSFCPPHGAG